MSQPVASSELLSDLVCDCIGLCKQGCICSLNEQPCTQACDCKASVDGNNLCMNIFTILATIRDDTCRYGSSYYNPFSDSTKRNLENNYS